MRRGTFRRDEATVDTWPLEKMILPGHLLDFTHRQPREAITPADFAAAARKSGRSVGPGTAVIAWTGHDKRFASEAFKTERPYVPAESAQWRVDRSVTLFGTERGGTGSPVRPVALVV